MIQLCWKAGLLSSQLSTLLHRRLLEHQLCPQQIGLHKLVLFTAVPEVSLVSLPHSAQSDHQVLQSGPVPFVSIPILKILPRAAVDLQQAHSKVALVLVLVLHLQEEPAEEVVNGCHKRLPLHFVRIFQRDNKRVGLGDAVPDGLGEIPAEIPDGVFTPIVDVQDVALVHQIVPGSLAPLPRLVTREGVHLLLEHVEQVDVALEEEALGQLHVRVAVRVHLIYICRPMHGSLDLVLS